MTGALALPRLVMARLPRGRLTKMVATVAVGTVIAGGASLVVNPPGSSSGGACAVSTQYVPDGPDNQGGCFPGTSNTGPDAPEASMSPYSGPCTISTPNTTIDSQVIDCTPSLVIDANNITISNSYLHNGITQTDPSYHFVLQDSYMDNETLYAACSGSTTCAAGYYACGDPNNATTDCGVTGSNFDIYRTEIVHTNRSAYCEAYLAQANCTIEDNYFHDVNFWPDDSNLAHGSSVRNEQYITFRHNTLACDYEGPFPNSDIGCSADMSGYPDFVPIMHDTIDGNLFVSNNVGIYFCMYGGGTTGKPYSNDPDNATYIVVTNNVFQKGANGLCGVGYWVDSFLSGNTGNVWSGNILDDGTTAAPDG